MSHFRKLAPWLVAAGVALAACGAQVSGGVASPLVLFSDGRVDASDGLVDEGTTVFNDSVAAVANLDIELVEALRRAAADAAIDGVTFYVNSGWRSADYQDQLLEQAVEQYGSPAEAARWVATSSTSPHVSGDAVDVGQYDAIDWLAQHGARYGLCQIYANEPWHFEFRPAAVENGCARMYSDPTQDPRMQQ